MSTSGGGRRAAAREWSSRAAKPERSTLPVLASAGASGAGWAAAAPWAAVAPAVAAPAVPTVVEAPAGAGTASLGEKSDVAVTPLVVPGPAERTASTWYW